MRFREFTYPAYSDDGLVLEFLRVFSRFEYALKCDGWTETDRNSGVSASWDKFAVCLRHKFTKDQPDDLKEAAEYILQDPPQRQILRDGELGWDQSKIQDKTDLEKLLLYVRRIRNNLFHGGKSQQGSPTDYQRNAELLGHGLTVLHGCLLFCREHRPTLVEHFESH